MNIGCHVSIAGGIWEAPQRAADLGCECFQMFTRPPQGGKAPTLTNEICEKFKVQSARFKIKEVYIHTPYYINFASVNNRIRYGSISVVRDELERGSLIGAKYVMTHLGTAKDLGEEAIPKTIEMLKKCLDGYSGTTQLLLENSAGAGAIIGDDLKELGNIIKEVGNKNIAGICLDTQHSFASGYDWNDFEKTLEKIDKEIGLENIKLFHVNNSESELGSKKDRHAHLDSGKINPEAFQKIVEFAQKNNIDLILETEHDQVKEDIEILKGFRK
ncbi:MAG: deoxyribonuclease IV [Candidatus Moranbacteria bacterium]|nr:deoxyribonuclease IV [Candidatus Moranbacteria bacterium]